MRRLLAALIMVLAFGGSAWAEDWSTCRKVEDPDPSIRACTDIIAAGQESREYLSIAHGNRGGAYYTKGDYERAIADETQAVQLNPQNAEAYADRGQAEGWKPRVRPCHRDLDKAMRLKPLQRR